MIVFISLTKTAQVRVVWRILCVGSHWSMSNCNTLLCRLGWIYVAQCRLGWIGCMLPPEIWVALWRNVTPWFRRRLLPLCLPDVIFLCLLADVSKSSEDRNRWKLSLNGLCKQRRCVWCGAVHRSQWACISCWPTGSLARSLWCTSEAFFPSTYRLGFCALWISDGSLAGSVLEKVQRQP